MVALCGFLLLQVGGQSSIVSQYPPCLELKLSPHTKSLEFSETPWEEAKFASSSYNCLLRLTDFAYKNDHIITEYYPFLSVFIPLIYFDILIALIIIFQPTTLYIESFFLFPEIHFGAVRVGKSE